MKSYEMQAQVKNKEKKIALKARFVKQLEKSFT